MKLKLTFLVAFILSVFSAKAQIEEPVTWSSKVTELSAGEYELTMTATIEAPWYMYDMGPYDGGPNPTVFTFSETPGVELVGKTEPVKEAERKHDAIFNMEIGHYADSASFIQKVKVTSASGVILRATVEWQTCNDDTCLPPMEHDFVFRLNGTDGTAPADNAAITANSNIAPTPTGDPAILQGDLNEEKSIWGMIVEAILWGFAALLTPCVFPMVPMTVSFFMKGSDNKARGRMMASFYGLSIIALYTLPIAVIIFITWIVGGDAVTADIFNWLSTHWIPNVLFFLIFMFFAASFFGAFEIVLPSWLVNKSDSKADKGGFIGTFFMALTLVLVSFSCTGPIVGSILVQSTQGEVWQPIITMLVFSTAFALPFTLFAFFPSLLKNLPKSGGWLNSVKVVLGFVELALGMKFLSVADQTYHWGILDREVYLAFWIVIFTLLGLYFLGKIKFAHDSDTPYVKVKSLFLAIITFAFVVYLIPGMWGAPLKALSGYLPPMHTLDFNLYDQQTSGNSNNNSNSEKITAKYSDFLHLPHNLEGFFDYNEGMAYAKKVGKPVFIDFTGHGCVNCREMEANVWADPRVLDILRNDYVIIALYVDDKKELPESDWVTTSSGKVLKTIGKINADFQAKRFNVNGQPYYVLLDNDGEMLAPTRGYNLDVNGYIQFLEDGLKKYKEQQQNK